MTISPCGIYARNCPKPSDGLKELRSIQRNKQHDRRSQQQEGQCYSGPRVAFKPPAHCRRLVDNPQSSSFCTGNKTESRRAVCNDCSLDCGLPERSNESTTTAIARVQKQFEHSQLVNSTLYGNEYRILKLRSLGLQGPQGSQSHSPNPAFTVTQLKEKAYAAVHIALPQLAKLQPDSRQAPSFTVQPLSSWRPGKGHRYDVKNAYEDNQQAKDSRYRQPLSRPLNVRRVLGLAKIMRLTHAPKVMNSKLNRHNRRASLGSVPGQSNVLAEDLTLPVRHERSPGAQSGHKKIVLNMRFATLATDSRCPWENGSEDEQ